MADTISFLNDQFDILEAVFNTHFSAPTRAHWSRRLAGIDQRVLRRAFAAICDGEDKRPSLATVIRYIRNLNPSNSFVRSCEGKDKQGVPCWYWSDDSATPTYRAADCADGRNFLAEFGKLAGKTPDQMAHSFEKWCAKETSAAAD